MTGISPGGEPTSVDVVLTRRSGHLVVTPEAGLGANALRAVLGALVDRVRTPLVIDLSHVLPTEPALLAVHRELHGLVEPHHEVRLVADRPVARQRIGRVFGTRGRHVYPTVTEAIGAA